MSNVIGFQRAYLPPGGTPTLFFASGCVAIYIQEIYYQSRIRSLIQTKTYRKLIFRFILSLSLGSIGAWNAISTLKSMRATGVLHSKPTTTIITHGCYARCRNPMYSYIIMLYFSIALGWNSRMLFGSALFCFCYLNFITVPTEEKFLHELFPKEYNAIITKTKWCYAPTLC